MFKCRFMLQRVLLMTLLFCVAMLTHAKVVVVSPNGDELQQAFNSAQAGDVFILKNGTYERTGSAMFLLPSNAASGKIDSITIIGESRDSVYIVANLAGTADVANTMYLRGNDWYVENITVENVATSAQARALRTRGDRMIFYNVKQISHQDTHNADGAMQYCFKCETWGDVDFIYGDAAIMYDSSLIVSRKRGGGHITAPCDTKTKTGTFKHGICIKNSRLVAEDGLADNTVNLGRPWCDNSASVFLNCTLGPHIRPQGWTEMGAETYKTTYMAEYNSRNPNGTPVDVSQRISWSKQLTAADTSKYSIEFFFKGWDPRAVINSTLDAPFDLRIDGDSLRWRAVSSARGYLIYRNDSLQTFTDELAYDVSGKTGERYAIRTLNQVGIPGSDVPRLEQTITWEQDTIVALDGPNIVLTATSSSGLPITYSSNDTLDVLRWVSSNELEILFVGDVTITATQAGNAEYAPAIAVSKIFRVLYRIETPPATGVGSLHQVAVQVYPNPVDDMLNLSFDTEGTYDIFLSDLSGAVVYKTKVSGISHSIDVSSYASSAYLLFIEDAQKKRTVQKVVIR